MWVKNWTYAKIREWMGDKWVRKIAGNYSLA